MKDEIPVIGFLRYSREAVEKALARGEPFHFEEALPTLLDGFLRLAESLGVLQGFEGLTDPREEGHIPLPVGCAVTMCRFLYALPSFRRVGRILLRDHALLQRLGMLPVVCEEGYYHCARDDDQDEPDEPHKPFTVESVLDMLNALDLDEVQELIVTMVQALRKRQPRLFRRGLFIMDSNDFRLKGSGTHYKWCALMLWTPYGMIPVAMEFSATKGEGTGETSVGRRVVERALQAYGEGFIKTLLMDTGYLDGPGLHWLKYEHGIDWVMDPKEDMKVTESMLSKKDEKPQRPWRLVAPPRLEMPEKQLPTRKVMWLGEQRGFFTYRAPVNGCVVWDRYPADKEHPEEYDSYQVLLTSHLEWSGPQIHDHSRMRWCIESTFGVMTNQWGLGKWEIKRLAVYEAAILFMALTFGLLVVYLYEEGQPGSLRDVADRLVRQTKGKMLLVCGRAAMIVTPAILNDLHGRGLMDRPAP